MSKLVSRGSTGASQQLLAVSVVHTQLRALEIVASPVCTGAKVTYNLDNEMNRLATEK